MLTELANSEYMSSKFQETLGKFEAFRAYWTHLQQEAGGVPPRSAFNPNAVRDLLPYISLMERRAADDLHVRLAGTAIDNLSPTPLTGRNYLEYCPPEDKAQYLDAATAMVEVPCGFLLKRAVTFRDGHVHELSSLALPMKDAAGEIRYLLSITAVKLDAAETQAPVGQYVAIRHIYSEYIDLGYGVPA